MRFPTWTTTPEEKTYWKVMQITMNDDRSCDVLAVSESNPEEIRKFLRHQGEIFAMELD